MPPTSNVRNLDQEPVLSEVRGPGLLGPHAVVEYRALEPDQVLLLIRERDNERDANAIIATTELGVPVGYIARQDAAWLAAEIDQGVPWRCRVIQKGFYGRWPQVELKKETRHE